MGSATGSDARAELAVLYVFPSEDAGGRLERAATAVSVRPIQDTAGVRGALSGGEVDCVVVDDRGGDAVAVLEAVADVAPGVPTIVLAETGERADRAIDAGATDFLLADPDVVVERVVRRVRHAAGDRTPPATGAAAGGHEGSRRSGTERALVRRARRERRIRERLFETVPVGVLLLDAEGTILEANERAEQLLDLERDTDGTYDAPEWKRRYPTGDPVPEEDLLWRRVVDTGRSIADFDSVLVWPDGRRRHVRGSAAPLFGDSGDVQRVVFAFQDTTATVRQQREREFVEQLVAKVGVGVAAIDAEGTVAFANPAVADLIGTSVPELEGTDIWAITPDLDAEAFARQLEMYADGRTHRFTMEIRRADGTTVPVELLGTRVAVDGTDYIVTTIKNISERREREQRLTVLNRVLRHNLRNELNLVLGHVEQLKAASGRWTDAPTGSNAAGADGEETRGGAAERAVDASGRSAVAVVEAAVRDLLELSEKARTMETTLARRTEDGVTVDAAAVAAAAVGSVRERHPGVTFDIEAPGTVPVRADDTLEMAIEELLRNAVEHHDRPPSGVTIEVRIRTIGDRVHVSVADDGPGIPPDERRVLTDPDTISPLYHGSGLGLWMVTWIVRQFDGDVGFVENDPRGSVVRVTLPGPDTD